MLSGRTFFIINIFCLGLIWMLLLISCIRTSSDVDKTLFKKLSPSKTGIYFQNNLNYTKKLNPYTYRNFYNGGGVGIGDFNNDDLQDIFFTGNQVYNKLYLNQGDFTFEDITKKAGVASSDVWSTGVSIVDINGDGWLDIYVCKSGSPGGLKRHNELFINNGDLTFTEKAKEYGLDVIGLSTDAHFFDYDRDGDLDMYLLNNSFQPITNSFPKKDLRKKNDPNGGDRLFRNEMISSSNQSDSDKKFIDITSQAGIYSSKIGFGLDILTGDINMDGWPDLYITNDFFERDYLYINNRDGSFREVLPAIMPSISFSSMGGDMGDINHDGYPEIFVTDMLPESWERAKSKTAFDFWEEYDNRIKNGYHYQFVRNTLQLNRGVNNSSRCRFCVNFSEISRLAGVEATDWSWTAFFADLNNDGNNDILVTNGIYKDLTDQDFVNNRATIRKMRSVIQEDKPVSTLFDDISSTPISNYAFQGTDSLYFKNRSKEWGLADPGFSSGAAYADFDNDGDLDLALNNVNQPASIYRNRAQELNLAHHSLTIKLHGNRKNSLGVGAKIKAWVNDTLYYREQFPNRGFQSSVDPRIHIGLGRVNKLDSLKVIWPDGSYQLLTDVTVDSILTFDQSVSTDTTKLALPSESDSASATPLLKEVTDQVKLVYRHRENDFVDFKRNSLLMRMRSTEGPAACVADINNDGLDDLYLGGAKGQAGRIYIQKKGWSFQQLIPDVIQKDHESEDLDCAWFDADGDFDLDLYVTSGGSEFPSSSSALGDRLYINRDTGFSNGSSRLPMSRYNVNSVVEAMDYDEDGDVDLFTGSHFKPFAYGIPADGNILINDGKGYFKDKTEQLAPDLTGLGMITDATWTDIDLDKDHDLVIVGEWMSISVFQNMLYETGTTDLRNITDKVSLGNSVGWWQSVKLVDLNSDGYQDIIAGNYGLNNRFRSFVDNPLVLWINDFDQNGIINPILTYKKDQKHIPLVLKQDLEDQIPALKTRIKSYQWYAGRSIEELFTAEELKGSITQNISTLQSTIYWNNDGKSFTATKFPMKTQLSPVFAISQSILDEKLFLTGGNLSGVKPQIGRYMSSYGSVIHADTSKKPKRISHKRSGFFVEGEIRSILTVNTAKGTLILAIRNNDTPVWFKKNRE